MLDQSSSSQSSHSVFPTKYLDAINAEVNVNYFTPILKKTFDNSKHKRVVDVGCGNGVFSVILKKWGAEQLVGVDGEREALERAKNNGFDQVIFNPDFSKQSIDSPNDSFDLAICKDVLEHLLNPDFLIKELSRILRKNGTLIAHVPNHFPFFARLRFLRKNDLDTFSYFPGSDRWDFPHIRFFQKKNFVERIESAGFVVESNFCPNFHYVPLSIPSSLKIWLAERDPDNFSQGLCFTFRKT